MHVGMAYQLATETDERTHQPTAANSGAPGPSSSGLDWLVAQAAARGMRTLLVLTDAGGGGASTAASGGGGASDAQQYCSWVDLGRGEMTIGGFYGNNTVKVRSWAPWLVGGFEGLHG